jgi:hypothetical protein
MTRIPLHEMAVPDSESDTDADQPNSRRPLGLLKGKIWMAEDFDEMPDDLIALMEGLDEYPQ